MHCGCIAYALHVHDVFILAQTHDIACPTNHGYGRVNA